MLSCWNCGAAATCHHHPIPQSRGGTKTLPLCGACHDKAHESTAQQLVLEGLARAIAAGRVGARVPLGFTTARDGSIVPDESWANKKQAVVSLRSQGASQRKIASALGITRFAVKQIIEGKV